MRSLRGGWFVAIVLVTVGLLAVLQPWAKRSSGRHAPRAGQRGAAVQAASAVGHAVGRVSVRLADGSTLAIPDGKRHVALWIGEAGLGAQAAGGLAQLAPVLPEVRYAVALLPNSPRPVFPPHAPPVSSPVVAVVDGEAAQSVATMLRQLPGQQQRLCDVWLIAPDGKVVSCSEGTGAAPIREADLVWPLIENEVATPRGFAPTSIARLSPDGANRQWRERKLRLWRQRLVEGYRQYRRHNAVWDQRATAFLEQRCLALALSDDAVDAMSLARMADDVLATGCNDPVVVHQCAEALFDNGESSRPGQAVRRLAKLCEGSQYPPRLLYPVAVTQVDDALGNASPEADRCYQLLGRSLAAPYAPGEQRVEAQIIFTKYMYDFDGPRIVRGSPAGAQALRTVGADLWLRAWLDGARHCVRAYNERGGDYAANTTPAQLAAFRAHLEAARRSLGLAWKLAPDRPEAAEEMITVCMGLGDRSGMRAWAERALSADIDAGVSAATFVGLWPRWGGSHEQMRAFAAEMADDSLVATDAPLALWQVEKSIAEDLSVHVPGTAPSPKRPAFDPAAVDAVLAQLDKMIAATDLPRRRARLRTYRLAVLVEAERGQQAVAAWHELGSDLDMSAVARRPFRMFETLSGWLIDQTIGMATWREMDDLRKAGKFAEARARCQTALARCQSALVRRWLADELAGLSDLMASTKAAAMPAAQKSGAKAQPMLLDAALSHWECMPQRPAAGEAGLEAGGVLRLSAGGTFFTYDKALPANVLAAVEVSMAKAPKRGLTVGLVKAGDTTDLGPSLRIRGDGTADAGMWGGPRNVKLPPGEWHRVRLSVSGGKAVFDVDGQELPLSRAFQASGWQFQMIVDAGSGGEAVRVRGLQWQPIGSQ